MIRQTYKPLTRELVVVLGWRPESRTSAQSGRRGRAIATWVAEVPRNARFEADG